VGYGDENINVLDNANYVDAVTQLSTPLHTGYVSNLIGDQ
jgi:hypothetical protein